MRPGQTLQCNFNQSDIPHIQSSLPLTSADTLFCSLDWSASAPINILEGWHFKRGFILSCLELIASFNEGSQIGISRVGDKKYFPLIFFFFLCWHILSVSASVLNVIPFEKHYHLVFLKMYFWFWVQLYVNEIQDWLNENVFRGNCMCVSTFSLGV